MSGYLTTADVLKHLARAQADGVRCAIACTSLRGAVSDERLKEAGIEPGTLTIEQPALVRHSWETTGALVERLVLAGHGLVYVLSCSTAWGNEVWTLAYAGEPLASVSDVDHALADGDGIDVRDGELWLESPLGSGLWHFTGAVLDSVADHMRRRGLSVA